MIILDENIVDGQRLLLEGWNITARQIGLDVGRKGLKDEEIVTLLHRLRQPTSSPATKASIHQDFDIRAMPSRWPLWANMSLRHSSGV